MSAGNYDKRAIDIVAELAELPAGAAREARLAELCGADESLRSNVETLLREQTAAVTDQTDSSDELTIPASLNDLDLSGQDIGRYHLLERIGEGGMGSVYKAQQREPVQRLVAIKLIKLGMDTRQVIARFEAERQALAMMNHPNVAKVLDAGTTGPATAFPGRPFFAMEYVPGEPITTYCDRHRLGTEQRLELFDQVCDAVQHAHHKGIIHRDIKPQNVLVTLQDARPVPKVIDFGVAKALNQRLTEETYFTQRGQFLGTPEYMSPEQAEMGALDIDTRCDVYSLGVLLYELLTGALPFDTKTLRQAAYGEMQRIIREVDPPRPSTRLSSLGEQSAALARSRGADAGALVRRLRGDLDWITMKALEKDRTRRYATPAELSADLRRHLAHQPVLAGPPSHLYRMRKFVRRNRGLVVAACAVILALLLGIIGTSIGLVRESRQRARAQQAAQTEQAVNQFLQNMLSSVDPSKAQGKPVLVLDVLDRAAQSVASGFKDRPLVEASIRTTIGATYDALGQYDAALPHVARALELRRSLLGDDDPGTLEAQNNLAYVLASLRRFEQAEPMARDVLARRLRVLGTDHPDTLTSLHNLARCLERAGRMREAQPIYRDAFTRRQHVLGADQPDTITSENSLAVVLQALGRLADAQPLVSDVVARDRRLFGEDHPATLAAQNNLASLLVRMGRASEAVTLQHDTLQRCQRVLGAFHPDTLAAMQTMVQAMVQLGQVDPAIALCRKAFDRATQTLGADDPVALSLEHELAGVLAGAHRSSEAESLFRDVCQRRQRVLGDDSPDTLASKNNLAMVLAQSDRLDQAEPLFREVVQKSRRVLGPDNPSTLAAMEFHGQALLAMNRPADAQKILREAMDRCQQSLGQNHPQTLGAMAQLAHALYATGDDAQADALLTDAVARSRQTYGQNHALTRALTLDLKSRRGLASPATAPTTRTQ